MVFGRSSLCVIYARDLRVVTLSPPLHAHAASAARELASSRLQQDNNTFILSLDW